MKTLSRHKLVLYIALCVQLFLSSCHAQPSLHSDTVPSMQGEELSDTQHLLVGADMIFNGFCIPQTSSSEPIPLIKKKNIAVVANQSSLVGTTHLVDTMLSAGFDVVKIFSPEHGFRGNAEAGATIKSSTDTKTGLPIVSLYGKNKKPTKEQMSDIDVVIFDLQDVGCRFYTYISTLHYVMEACAERGIPCIVLDRPNPNCHYVDGPVLDTAHYRSFIGMHPVPIVYGLTIGEYATMINGEHWLKKGLQCDLTVVKMKNYHRDSIYPLPVAPSPNLQTKQSIALYPSLCLFEGTNISVGRGTKTPFEIIGSPECNIPCSNSIFNIDGQKVPALFFSPHPIKGVSENPPHNGKLCRGLSLSDVKVEAKFNLSWLLTMYVYTPHDTFFKKSNSFELLAGTDQLRKQIQQGLSDEEIRASWEPALTNYKKIRKNYLLYPDIQ